jgi:hypothetical protein
MTEFNCSECGGTLTDSDHVHRQVPVSVEGRHAHVDEGIADLIEVCWRVGITNASCQDDPDIGRAYISFGPGSAERFVGAATTEDLDNELECLGWRIRGASDDAPDEVWQWQPGGFAWGVCFAAYFPPGDIPELTRRLSRWV